MRVLTKYEREQFDTASKIKIIPFKPVYPRYELSNGLFVDFMCMSKENMELYYTINKEKLLYDRKNKTWWNGDDQEYPKRTNPLLGVAIEKEIW